MANLSISNVQVGGVSDLQSSVSVNSGYKVNVWPASLPNNISSDANEFGPNQRTGHYMTMYVNTQKQTQYPSLLSSNQSSSVPTVDKIFSTAAKTQRSAESFTIFVPDSVQFQSQQLYETFDIGGTMLAAGIAGAGSIQEYMRRTGGGMAQPRNLAASVLAPFGSLLLQNGLSRLGAGSGGFTALTGLAFNPFMEVIYSKPTFRTFRFDYLVFPRTPQESADLRTFIQRLRFHSAPENKGFFLIPPSTFDIEFFFGGGANANIEKIYTCVLESIDVDYTATGQWTTYIDGMPIGVRLSLQFKEIVYLTKENYASEYESAARDAANVQNNDLTVNLD